jgi:hypothetical protein
MTPVMAVFESTSPKATTEVTAGRATAEVSAVSAPMAAGRDGGGCDHSTSQCRGSNDDRDSVQGEFPHDYCLRSKYSTMARLVLKAPIASTNATPVSAMPAASAASVCNFIIDQTLG